jgi:CRP-like cAMP-binding protein
MNHELLVSHIDQSVRLDPSEKVLLESMIIERPFKQGELIVRSGEPARYLLFVGEGYVMTYFTDNTGEDRVVRFAGKGWWSPDIYALSDESKTAYSTKGLGEGLALLLPRPAIHQLLTGNVKFERYFRILCQNSLIKQQRRMLESYSATADERYIAFREAYPSIEQYVPQKYIASYLGISAEFLSKIRKQIATGKS